jgi:hypothetical protein
MHRTILIRSSAGAMIRADLGVQPPTQSDPVSPMYLLTDTTGREITRTHAEEESDLAGGVPNTTDKQLAYSRGNFGPATTFRVWQSDRTA